MRNSFFSVSFVYVCVCAQVHMHGYVYVEARGWHQMSFSLLLNLIFLRRSLSLALELTWPSIGFWYTSWPASSSLCHQCYDHRRAPSCQVLTWVLGSKLGSSSLHSRHSTIWAIAQTHLCNFLEECVYGWSHFFLKDL